MNEKDWATVEKALAEANERWVKFFSRHGFAVDAPLNHEANKAFSKVVETERKLADKQVDFPIARMMFILGYLKATAQGKE